MMQIEKRNNKKKNFKKIVRIF